MRRAGLLLALVTILASSASPAAAHHEPATCANDNAVLTVNSSRTNVRPGETVTFSVTASNFGINPCAVSADVSLQLPGPTGAPTGQVVQLVDDGTLPANMGPVNVGPTVDYVVASNPGVTSITARATATNVVLHNADPDTAAAGRNDDVSTPESQPKLDFSFDASPLSGFAPFRTTYEFELSNASTTTVDMDPPTIQHSTCPAANRSGDDGDNRLENGENWRYTCSRLFPTPLSFKSSATARAVSRVDGRNVLSTPPPLVTVNSVRPPAATLELTRSASPPSGPAPLTVTHSYRLRNASGADPRPVKDIVIDDRVCAPVTRTSGDDLLQAGETWTYTCTQTLATAQTLSGTAVANGKDDLGFNTVSSSNLAAIEVTATAVNPAPTPAPTATPDPDPDVDPDETQPPSRRVNFATTRGRLARPCGKTATAQLKVGKRLIASKRIRLDSRCRYRVRFTNVTRSRLRGATRVSVTVRSGRRTATHRVAVPTR